jgi:hypothetical protein
MVLSALGLDMEEASLRHLTDCTPLGTEAFQVLEAARHLGFPASRKYTLTPCFVQRFGRFCRKFWGVDALG